MCIYVNYYEVNFVNLYTSYFSNTLAFVSSQSKHTDKNPQMPILISWKYPANLENSHREAYFCQVVLHGPIHSKF